MSYEEYGQVTRKVEASQNEQVEDRLQWQAKEIFFLFFTTRIDKVLIVDLEDGVLVPYFEPCFMNEDSDLDDPSTSSIRVKSSSIFTSKSMFSTRYLVSMDLVSHQDLDLNKMLSVHQAVMSNI